MSDTDIMPYGRHKGIKMANVPAEYLMALYETKRCKGKVKEYIEDNLYVLQMEIADKKNNSI